MILLIPIMAFLAVIAAWAAYIKGFVEGYHKAEARYDRPE